MKQRLTPRLRSAFTIVEVLVAVAILGLTVAGLYAMVRCANILFAKTYAVNATGTEVHNALDRIQNYLQQSYTPPLTIDSNGAVVNIPISGSTAYAAGMVPVTTGATATTGPVVGPASGIKFYRYVGGPYLMTPTNTNTIPGNVASLNFEYDPTLPAEVLPPKPQPGDFLVINTTALLGVSGTYQVWATVGTGAITATVSSTNKMTYTVPLVSPLRVGPDATSGTASIQYVYDNTAKKAITWSTILLRPTAFLFYTNGTTTELRLYDPFTLNGSNVNVSGTHSTLTRELYTSTTTPSQFCIVPFGNSTFVSMILRMRCSDYDQFLTNKQSSGFSTYMGVNYMVHLKSNPLH